MSKISNENRAPTFGKSSFKCPYCGSIAHQDWFELRAKRCDKEKQPFVLDDEFIRMVQEDPDVNNETKEKWINQARKYQAGNPFISEGEHDYIDLYVNNAWLSKCFSCEEISIWIHGRLVFPKFNFVIEPNQDLPEDIKATFIEAARIYQISPRGSAALLRLCLQKICKHLGKPGNNINQDIASLVRDGLDPRIQRALDIVRVIGNNAVHPGHMDVHDDVQTSVELFKIINIIADAMISQPKRIKELYEGLPDSAKSQIQQRDSGQT